MAKEVEIRDMRNGEWSWVYNALIADPHLSPQDKIIYNSLASFAGMHEIRPSYATIGKRANLSERTAIRSIQKLESVGYITTEKKDGGRHRTNRYFLLKRLKGCLKCTVSETMTGNGETMTGVARNPDRVSPNKDIEKDSKKDIAASAAEWTQNDLREYLHSMNENKNRALHIIALYLTYKGVGVTGTTIQLKNKAQAQVEIKRYLRAANTLKVYNDEQLENTLADLAENARFDWKLENVLGYINYDQKKRVEILKSIGRKSYA